MPSESQQRLDRIERLTEQNANAISQLTVDIAATNIEMRAGFAVVAEALKDMAQAQKEMLESQNMLLRTLDRLAQLWGRSPN